MYRSKGETDTYGEVLEESNPKPCTDVPVYLNHFYIVHNVFINASLSNDLFRVHGRVYGGHTLRSPNEAPLISLQPADACGSVIHRWSQDQQCSGFFGTCVDRTTC
jgi:hypothetical protein